MESSEASPIENERRLGLFKHAGLAFIAVIVSGTLMSRVKGGWSFEPLIWLALVWYFGLLFLVDFIIFRGRGRIKTLLVILTGVAVVIMFPFSAIRKAEYRARILDELEPPGRIEKVQLLEQWNWWELPTGECIPRCLAWRVPVAGIDRQDFLFLKANEIGDFPKWLVDEVEILHIDTDGLPPRLIRNRLAPETLSISSAQATFTIDESRRLQEKRHEKNVDWIDQVVSLERCTTMHLFGVSVSTDTWSKILSSKNLQELVVDRSQIPEENWHCDLPQLQRLFVSNAIVGSQSLKKLISNSARLKHIVISVDQLTSEFAKEIASRDDLKIVVNGMDESGPRKVLQIKHKVAFDGKVRLELCFFRSLNFADQHLQTLIRSTASTEITSCELSFRNVTDIVEFELAVKVAVDGSRNPMEKNELQLLVAWIAEQSGDSKILASKIDQLTDLQFYLKDSNVTEARGLFELIRRKIKK
jgi:hypothetical protein